MGFSIEANSDFRHVPVPPLPNNSDKQTQTEGEPSSSDVSPQDRGEAVENPRRPRRIRIRIRRPAGRESAARRPRPRKRLAPAPLLGPDLRGLSPLTQALLVGAFIATVFLLWQFLHAFR